MILFHAGGSLMDGMVVTKSTSSGLLTAIAAVAERHDLDGSFPLRISTF
jgi:hypothetical protein